MHLTGDDVHVLPADLIWNSCVPPKVSVFTWEVVGIMAHYWNGDYTIEKVAHHWNGDYTIGIVAILLK